MRRIRPTTWTLLALLLAGTWLVPSAAAQPQEEIPLGSAMPMAARGMLDTGGRQVSLNALKGEAATVVVFWSNQCPWVGKYRDRIVGLADAHAGRGVSFVFVNSNDAAAFPQESLEENRKQRLPGTYVVDEGSQLATAFGATRTPQVYVFDADASLAYVGTVDDSPGDPGNVKTTYLSDALDAVSGGNAVAVPKTKAFGCMIKFKQ